MNTNPNLELGPQPRILFLCTDAAAMRAQLAGQRLTQAQAGLLRDDVSTDEITPVHIMSHYDDRLARFPYTGFQAGDKTPIAAGAVLAGGFSVTVAGGRYGKGSSREHSPAAEKLAGIRLVIARSFERIYRQNADNIGLFTSTDFGLIERFIHEYYTGMAAHMLHSTLGRPLRLHEPDSIVVLEDHTSYVDQSPAHLRAGLVPNMRAMCEAQREFAAAYGLRSHRTLTDEEAMADDGSNRAGISHDQHDGRTGGPDRHRRAGPGNRACPRCAPRRLVHDRAVDVQRCGCSLCRHHRGRLRRPRSPGGLARGPSCGACANCGPGSSTSADQVTVSAINRNFPGRSGPGQVWLASPPTVMASALAGEVVSYAALRRRVGQ